MHCTVEMASSGMIYIRSFMIIGSGIQVTLRVLSQQSGRLHGIYGICALDGLRWYDVQSFSKTGSGTINICTIIVLLEKPT
jgi:hypothetical protein